MEERQSPSPALRAVLHPKGGETEPRCPPLSSSLGGGGSGKPADGGGYRPAPPKKPPSPPCGRYDPLRGAKNPNRLTNREMLLGENGRPRSRLDRNPPRRKRPPRPAAGTPPKDGRHAAHPELSRRVVLSREKAAVPMLTHDARPPILVTTYHVRDDADRRPHRCCGR